MLNQKLSFFRRIRDEEGAALVSVVALLVVSALVVAAVSVSLFTANGVTTLTRADVQSKAAADAGIDAAYAQIAIGNYICTAPAVAGGPTYAATVAYKNASGTALSCGITATGTPASAVITSIGTAANSGTRSTSGNTQTVAAVVTITPAVTATPVTLDKVIYSDSSFNITNNSSILASTTGGADANVYTNGSATCATQLSIQGPISSQGDANLNNNCLTSGTVWSGGNVSFGGNGVSVGGDVYAAGTGQLNLNGGHVKGNVLTNGSFTTSNGANSMTCASGSWSVCGSVVALGGGASISQNATVGGSVYARDSISLSNQNGLTTVGTNVLSTTGSLSGQNSSQDGKVTGNVRVKGSIGIQQSYVGDKTNSCQGTASAPYVACPTLTFPALVPASTLPTTLGYPSATSAAPVLNGPPRESMPKIASDPTTLAQWTGWTLVQFTAATAAANSYSNSCEQAKAFIAGTTWSGKTLLTVTGCSNTISWANNTQITLRGDLAVISPSGFSGTNLSIKSSTSGVAHQLMTIVPSDSSFVTWTVPNAATPTVYTPSCSGSIGNISFDQMSISDTSWLVYSPCSISFSNTFSGFKGQIYGGSVSYPNNSTIQLSKISVPGLTASGGSSGSTAASATITSRYDVAG